MVLESYSLASRKLDILSGTWLIANANFQSQSWGLDQDEFLLCLVSYFSAHMILTFYLIGFQFEVDL